MKMVDLKEQEAVVEAVLFTMGQSVEIRQLAAALETGEKEAEEAAERLKKRYGESVCGMQIVRLEDSYQMCTSTGYYENLIRVAATPKKQVLTDVVMETLAIIAYKQPVTKAEIEKIRGVKSDHAVNRLIEYNLVYEAGRLDAPGRPALFATTEDFLRRFGVSSTGELPTMDMEQKEEIRTAVEEELNLKLTEDGKLAEQEVQEEQETEREQEAQEEQETAREQEAQEEQETARGQEAQEEQETVRGQEVQEEQETARGQEVQEEQETARGQEVQEEQETERGQEVQEEQETARGQEVQEEQETERKQEAQEEQETEREQEAQEEQETARKQEAQEEQETEREQETQEEQETQKSAGSTGPGGAGSLL